MKLRLWVRLKSYHFISLRTIPSSRIHSGDSFSFSPLLRPVSSSIGDFLPTTRFTLVQKFRAISFSKSVPAPYSFPLDSFFSYFLVRSFCSGHLEQNSLVVSISILHLPNIVHFQISFHLCACSRIHFRILHSFLRILPVRFIQCLSLSNIGDRFHSLKQIQFVQPVRTKWVQIGSISLKTFYSYSLITITGRTFYFTSEFQNLAGSILCNHIWVSQCWFVQISSCFS